MTIAWISTTTDLAFAAATALKVKLSVGIEHKENKLGPHCNRNTSPGLSIVILLGTLSDILRRHMLGSSIRGVMRCWRKVMVMAQRISMSTAAVSTEVLLILVIVRSSSYHLVESTSACFWQNRNQLQPSAHLDKIMRC
jgi:hypothetical protein